MTTMNGTQPENRLMTMKSNRTEGPTIGSNDRADHGWEHYQIDLVIDRSRQGIALLHRFERQGLQLFGLVEQGQLTDLLLYCREEEVDAEELQSVIATDDGTGDPPLLSRVWLLRDQHMRLQAYVWVNGSGRGFIDIFVRTGLP